MLAPEEGEEALFILQMMFCCSLLEEEGVRLVDIMVWMVRWDQMAPEVWEKNHHKFEMEVLVGSLVNVTLQGVTTMEEWVRVGLVKAVPDWAPPMGKEGDHVLKAGLEVKLEV